MVFICDSTDCNFKTSFETFWWHHYARLYPLHSYVVVLVWTFHMSQALNSGNDFLYMCNYLTAYDCEGSRVGGVEM